MPYNTWILSKWNTARVDFDTYVSFQWFCSLFTTQNFMFFSKKRSDFRGFPAFPLRRLAHFANLTTGTSSSSLAVGSGPLCLAQRNQLGITLPETNSSPLKIGLWKRRFLLESIIFRGYGYVSFRQGRWWFQIFFWCAPLFGEDCQFDEHIFQMGWNHQLTN